MSTRATIQKMTADGPIGSYSHWDGYPEGLGKALWDLAQERPLDELLTVLIDDHHAWSTFIDADWTQPIGYGGPGPQCYCHGQRQENNELLSLADAPAVGCEWAYVFYPEQRLMKVLSSYTGDGTKMIGMFGVGDPDAKWRVVAELALDGPEPDWSYVQRGGD